MEFKTPSVEVMRSGVEALLSSVGEVETSADLLPHYKTVMDLLVADELSIVDDMLRDLDVSQATLVMSTGILRLTSSWKSQLPQWEPLLERVRPEVESRGLGVDEILVGLV